MLLPLVVTELETERRHQLDSFRSQVAGVFDRLEQAQRAAQFGALLGGPRLIAVTVRNYDVEIDLMCLVDDVAIHDRIGPISSYAGPAGANCSVVNASKTSPSLMSLKFSIAMPHSYPSVTSRTSSLKRLSDASLPSYTTTLSRNKRMRESRVTLPLLT